MKVSKALVALSLIGSLASFTFADDIDSEIAKLKKENELLELQKKIKILKKVVVAHLAHKMDWQVN